LPLGASRAEQGVLAWREQLRWQRGVPGVQVEREEGLAC
jgi:hypothetical protein